MQLVPLQLGAVARRVQVRRRRTARQREGNRVDLHRQEGTARGAGCGRRVSQGSWSVR